MIAQAFNAPCTCNDAFAGDILPCPMHGLMRAWHPPGPVPASTPSTGPNDPRVVLLTAYAEGMQAGYKLGIDAAMKLFNLAPGA